jgi:hypothetical protein
MWRSILRVVFILFCIEVGAFLLFLPWTEVWDRNFLLGLFPGVRGYLLSDWVRGAVSGLGVINLWLAFSDIWNFRRNLHEPQREASRPPAGAPPVEVEITPLEPRTRGR